MAAQGGAGVMAGRGSMMPKSSKKYGRPPKQPGVVFLVIPVEQNADGEWLPLDGSEALFAKEIGSGLFKPDGIGRWRSFCEVPPPVTTKDSE